MHHSAPAINPFAAPTYTSERTTSIVAGDNRASELVLRRMCLRLAIVEVSYALGCVSFLASLFAARLLSGFGGNMELQTFLSYLPIVFFTVTWIYLFSIHRVAQGWTGAIGALITFPIPLLGTFIFRAESVHANLFLYRNGYQRTFLGGKPNPEERQLMEADSTYTPSVYFDSQGKRRRRSVFTLGGATILGMIGFFIMSLVLI